MSDAESAVTEPALPAPLWTLGKDGRPAGYCRRDIIDGIRYLAKEGIQWRAMPADCPPWRTIYGYVSGWEKTGATETKYRPPPSPRKTPSARKNQGLRIKLTRDCRGLLAAGAPR